MNPTHEEIMRRVEEIWPRLAANAPLCEEGRKLAPESFELMKRAGLFRVVQPARFHGYQLSWRTLTQMTIRVSEACPSCGWVLGLLANHNALIAHFSEAAQRDIYGDGDSFVASGFAPQGVATAVEGGFRVDGRWHFSSGVDYSNWMMLGCASPGGNTPDRFVMVPSSEIEIIDNWHVLGMRGTGSKDVMVRGVFAPAYRSIPLSLFHAEANPNMNLHNTNLYRVPGEAVQAVMSTSTLVGTARAALQKFTELTRKRHSFFTGRSRAEYAPIQIHLAESAAEIHNAELLIQDALRQIDQFMIDPESSLTQRAQLKCQAAYTCELCRRALIRLYTASGAHAIYEGHPIQSALRDVNVGAQHAALEFDNCAEQYGAALLGLLEQVAGHA